MNSFLVIFTVNLFAISQQFMSRLERFRSGKTEWSGCCYSNKSDGYQQHTFLVQSEPRQLGKLLI